MRQPLRLTGSRHYFRAYKSFRRGCSRLRARKRKVARTASRGDVKCGRSIEFYPSFDYYMVDAGSLVGFNTDLKFRSLRCVRGLGDALWADPLLRRVPRAISRRLVAAVAVRAQRHAVRKPLRGAPSRGAACCAPTSNLSDFSQNRVVPKTSRRVALPSFSGRTPRTARGAGRGA